MQSDYKLLLAIRTQVIFSDQRNMTKEILPFSKHWNGIHTLSTAANSKHAVSHSLSIEKEHTHRYRRAIGMQRLKKMLHNKFDTLEK